MKKPIGKREAAQIAKKFAAGLLSQSELGSAFPSLADDEIETLSDAISDLVEKLNPGNNSIYGSTTLILAEVLAKRKK